MADTAALVVALSAQLSKFEKDLAKAGVIAEREVKNIEGKFEKMNPQVKASFLGNLFSTALTSSIDAATKAVTDFYARFKELDKQAQITGQSIKDMWAFQEAAKQGGASTEDALRGLREMLNLMNQMKRGQGNSLSELFDRNPQALQGINREALTLQQSMELVANMVRDARSELDKVDVAKAAGLSEEWVKTLERGGPAVTNIVAGFRAAAPPLDDLVAKAKLFDDYMKSAADWIKADTAAFIQNTIREFQGIKQFITGKGPTDTFADRFDALPKAPGGPTGARTTNVPFKAPAAAASAAAEASAYDRANDQITKHIALLEADSQAVGKNAGEQERLRTIATLKAAADRDGLKITAAMTEQMNAQANAAAAAALKLALAQHQLQEINEASREFGSGLADAFKGLVLEGKKLDEVLKNLMNRMASKAIDKMFDLIFAAGAGQSTSIFGALMKGFGGARAGGGSVSSGSSYLVGEHGPELFAPGQSGMVVPNQAIGRGRGGGLTVAPVYNIDASGADTAAVARLQAALIATNRSLEARALAAVSSHMARGA
jgi:hypothetical protein